MTKELIDLNKDATIQLWADRVSTCRSSNLTVREWCQQNGIAYSSYYHWQKKLFDTAVANAHPPVTQFAEVSLSTTSFTSQNSAHEVIASIGASGIIVQLYANAKAGAIAAICKGLKEC